MREQPHNPVIAGGSRFWRLALVLLAAVLMTAASFWQTRKAQLTRFRAEFEAEAAGRTAMIMQEADKVLLAVRSLGWFCEGTGNVDAFRFQAFATGCLAQRKELQAIEWIPRVSSAERASFEETARLEGLGQFRITERNPDGRFIAAPERETYYPVLYVQPLRGNEAALGFDVGSEAVRLAALERAQDTGEPIVIERIQWAQQADAQAGFLIVVAVYRAGMPNATVTERRAALEGFAAGVYQAGVVASAALRGAEPVGLSLALLDCSAPVGRQEVYRWEDTLKGNRSWKSVLFPKPPKAMGTFAFGGRQWGVKMRADPAYLERHCPMSYWLVLPAGLLLGLMTMGYLGTVLSSRERLAQLVAERTAALRESEARYRAVIEYSPDGMSVTVGGKLVYVNPAAVRLAGAREAGDLLGRSILEFVHEDYRAEVERRQAQMLKTGLPAPGFEGKLRRLDASIADAEWMGVPIVYDGKAAILSSFRDVTEPRRRARALRAIVSATAGSGDDFFRALVAELGKVLGVKYAMVGVLLPGLPKRVRSVALWRQGAVLENFDYELDVAPCANVVGQKLCYYPDDLQKLFPRDPVLVALGAVSYLGMPLFSSSGAALGLLWVIDDQPMPNSDLASSLMTILAARAASELERKEALDGLKASEAKYRQLHESMMDAFAAVDLGGRITECNESFRRMLGYDEKEVHTLTYQDITPAKWHAFEADIIRQQVFTRGYSDIYEKEYQRKDGTVFPVELRAILLRDHAGAPCGTWAVVRDITERKRAAEAMRRQMAFDELITRLLTRFASAIGPEIDESIGTGLEEIGRFIGVQHAAVLQFSPDLTTWSATHEWCAPGIARLYDKYQKVPMGTFAWTEKLLLAGEVVQIRKKEDFPPEAAAIRQRWESEGFRATLQVPLRGRGAQVRGCIGLYAVGHEVAWLPEDVLRLRLVSDAIANALERQRAEEALRRSEARYRTLFESAQDAIFLDQGDQFVDCNAMTLRMFGCRREQVIGQTPMRFSPSLQPDGRPSAEKAREKIAAAYAGTPQFFEWRHCRLDGSEFEAEVSLNRLELAEQPMLLAFVRDITARKQAEEDLRRAHDELEERVQQRTSELVRANARLQELDRLKSQFLATMSHELRTPLNSIIGFTGILRQGFAGPVNPEQAKQLGLVYGSGKHLLSLINDLLDLSRIEAGKVELEQQPFNFVEVIDEVLQNLTPMAQHRNLSLTADLAGQAIEMVGDRKRSFQVLLNLAHNAVKFTPRGGVTITARTERDTLRVCVADTGIGIKPEQMGLLFEAFRQLDDSARRMYEGTGLGLHLCQKLLSLMGGDIHVESQFGQGSRFTFTLPLQPAALPQAP